MGRYVHFEHYVDDPQKAVDFYSEVFGWKTERWGEQPYWLVTTGPDDRPGINGGISGTAAPNGQRVVNTIDVDDIDDAISRSQQAGATVVMGKGAIQGMGWVAYLTDPNGVVFGLYQNDQSAA
jgi:predicted enzyme related to lactoylglutathione lyase